MLDQFNKLPWWAQIVTAIIAAFVIVWLVGIVFTILTFLAKVAIFVLIVAGLVWVFNKLRSS